MYVDPKPLSTYGGTQGWKMYLPSPQPSGTLKRPPLVKTGSSFSSLSGMEQNVPSFQSFLKRTPPPDQQKPLPPTPLRPRRPSSFDSSSSRPASRFTRRSSSIYSRATSQWDLEPDVPGIPSWQTADFAERDLLLRPIAYSASKSQLIGKQPDQQQLLEPRTYSPLMQSPSPTISRRTIPSPPPEPRPSVLLPPPAGFVHMPKKHLRTVSLEKAKQMLQAPGAVHLLPEELRTQTLGKSRSQEPLRITSMDIMSGRMTPPELPEAPTLVDHQGRERLLSSPRASVSPVTRAEYPFPIITSPSEERGAPFHVGNGQVRTMAPLSAQTREASRVKLADALGLGDADEQRGRARVRGPRNMSYDHYMPNQKHKSDGSNSPDELNTNAQLIAQEYRSLLSEQYRQPFFSSASQSNRSDTDVRTHMKMVPQPLFHAKPAARLPGTPVSRDSGGSVSPFSMRADSGTAVNDRRKSSGGRGFFPLRLSVTCEGGHKRRSTSGSIPISPPSATLPKPAAAAPAEPTAPQKRQGSRFGRNSDDNRVSAYYPHVMSRKKEGKKDKTSAQALPVPMLAADIIAQRLKTADATPDGSPLDKPPSRDIASHIDAGSIHSERSNTRFPRRIFNKLTRSSESPARRHDDDDRSPMGRVASPESPQLLPSPASAKQPPAIHLGWSDVAKGAFDQARSSVQPPKRHPESLTTHVQTPARPLDERQDGLTEPESPGRKGSIFGGLMDGWRESKAEKRRQDLKKMIKVVTPETTEEEDQGASQKRPSLVSRRWSAYNWM